MSCNQLPYFPESSVSPAFLNDASTYCLSVSPASTVNRRAMLNASSGGIGPLPIVSPLLASPLSIASVSIGTRCLGTANVLLNFSGVLFLPAGTSVTLSIQFCRTSVCGQSVAVGGTYTLVRTTTSAQSETINFQVFDSNVQPGCYTYCAVLSDNSCAMGTMGTTISNAVLSALAVSDRS